MKIAQVVVVTCLTLALRFGCSNAQEALLDDESNSSNMTEDNMAEDDIDENVSSSHLSKESKQWKVQITYIEGAFNFIADGSFVTSGVAAAFGLLQIGVAILGFCWSRFCCRCIHDEDSEDSVCYRALALVWYFLASFGGGIYLAYFLTIPIFGLPERYGERRILNYLFPEPPHLHPANVDDHVFIKVLYAFINTIFLSLVLYLLLVSVMVFLGSLLVVPCVCLFIGILVALTRGADTIVENLQEMIFQPEPTLDAAFLAQQRQIAIDAKIKAEKELEEEKKEAEKEDEENGEKGRLVSGAKDMQEDLEEKKEEVSALAEVLMPQIEGLLSVGLQLNGGDYSG